eukprot:s615_g15.t1
MWECMTSETRKGRHLLSHCSRQASQAAKEERLSDVERSALIFQLHGMGVRRDKTSLLEKMRASASARQKRALPSAGEDTSASSSQSAQLSELYRQASQDIASLASRLAQHNGLRQFSATFSNRAPPLELRMLLPELEASIEQQLQSLERNSIEIAQLEFPDHSRMEELKRAVCSYLRSGLEDASITFEEQRSHLRVLQAAAPLTSPMTMPVPAMKFPSQQHQRRARQACQRCSSTAGQTKTARWIRDLRRCLLQQSCRAPFNAQLLPSLGSRPWVFRLPREWVTGIFVMSST